MDLLTIVGTIISKLPTVLSLNQGIDEFFINNTDGVLESPSMAVAIWFESDYYYLFDSRPCDMAGLRIIEEAEGNISHNVWLTKLSSPYI